LSRETWILAFYKSQCIVLYYYFIHLQVFVGKKPRKPTTVEEVFEVEENIIEEIEAAPKDYQYMGNLQIGDMVVIDIEEYNDEFPLIGEVRNYKHFIQVL
jgi:aldehyde:ferredoxin oxidoreductase